jgi:hypothetical protein
MRAKIASPARVGEQLLVARGDGEVGLGEQHVEVGEHRAERTATRATCARERAAPPRRGAPRTPATAAPKPYQPGSITRHCAHENTHGIARRSSIACDFLARGRARADVELAISTIGVVARKYSTKPGVP